MPKPHRPPARLRVRTSHLLIAIAILACGPAPQPFQSDDFNNCALDTGRWTFVDPVGDGSATLQGVGSSDVVLALSVGSGVSHDVWSTGNESARVMQSIGDADFRVEAKFESVPMLGYQIQGLLVEGSGTGNFLRFDFFSDGSNLHVFSASFSNGTPTVRVNQLITSGGPLYMRVLRQSSQWTLLYSYDGATWTQAVSYSQALTVTGAGVFAGNAPGGSNPPPAFTALVDYVFNVDSPISPEDAPGPAPTYALALNTSGNGTVIADPSGGSYACGTNVTVTAAPDPGWKLAGWDGSLSGSTNPATVSMTGPRSVTANFELTSIPPVISAVQVTPASNSATVTWTTDEPATSHVDYGTTAAYELGSADDATLSTAHSLSFGGLAPSSPYHVRVVSTDAYGNTTTGADVTLTTAPAPPSGLVSDDFNAYNIDPSRWSFVDPLGDSTVGLSGVNTGDAVLRITVPAGQAHDLWASGDSSARLMQAAANADFEVQVKFESQPTQRYQDQGILVEESPGRFLRFDFYSDGTALRLFAASIFDGAATTRQSTVITAGAPLYLKVSRVGDQWTQSYSYDGQTWLPGASFSYAMTVQSVGVYAANASSGGPSPAFTAAVDYFQVTGDPILAEDQAVVTDVLPPLVYDVGGVVDRTGTGADLEIRWKTDEAATTKVEWGLTTSYELGALQDGTLGTSHFFLLQGLTAGVTIHYRVTSVDALGHVTVSADQTLTTDVSGAPVMTIWYGNPQKFGQLGVPQPWVNILGNVSDPSGFTSFTYSLNGGPAANLSIGPDSRRLQSPGDFNVELAASGLLQGDNEVAILAVDTTGKRALEIVHLTFSSANTWPLPYSIDWTTVSNPQDVCQVVDGLWSFGASGAEPVVVGYDRLLDVGDLAWTDYEVTSQVTVHSIDSAGFAPPSNGPAIGLLLRWIGHSPTPGSQPNWYYFPFGAIGWYRWNPDGTEGLGLVVNPGGSGASDTSGWTLALGVTYVFKMRVETRLDSSGNPFPFYSFKVWPASSAEPASWTLTYPGSVGDPVAGSFLLLAHHVDATFGPVTAAPLGP